MKVTPSGDLFTLHAETEQDQQFLDAIDVQRSITVKALHRSANPSGPGFVNASVDVQVAHASTGALRHQAPSELLGALGQLVSLLLGEAAYHRHVGTDAANPQTQEQLASSLVELQLVLESLREMVGQQGAVLKEMQRAHECPSVVVAGVDIVAQEGGAA